eukprot:1161415-Pelagomonas_calceolata.AAC.3
MIGCSSTSRYLLVHGCLRVPGCYYWLSMAYVCLDTAIACAWMPACAWMLLPVSRRSFAAAAARKVAIASTWLCLFVVLRDRSSAAAAAGKVLMVSTSSATAAARKMTMASA